MSNARHGGMDAGLCASVLRGISPSHSLTSPGERGCGVFPAAPILHVYPDTNLLTDIALLHRLIEPEANALGFDLVRVRMQGGKGDPTLQVMAERPDTRQLNIDDCTALSHRISDLLDAMEAEGRDPIEEAYRLEVSSPGIDRPLTRLKDFADWTGHEARIRLVQPVDGRKQLTGNLAGVEGDTIAVDLGQHGMASVAFADVGDAKLVMTDRLIAATAPLSTDGADELEELDEDGVDDTAVEEEQ